MNTLLLSGKMLEVKKANVAKDGFVKFLCFLISYVHPWFEILSL
jgi:hypothetical protein